jgi:hypothetical protein
VDAGKYYALLRFEEASLALRAALKLDVVEQVGVRTLDLDEFRDLFGFTHQGARTYVALLEVMEVLLQSGRSIRIAPRAAETLADQLPTSRKPYLAMGTGDDVDTFIEQLRGNFPDKSLPLYGSDDVAETVMDVPAAAREIAVGLASRARNFAEPLAAAIKPFAIKAKIMADIGAGSPYVSQACLNVIPHLQRAILVDRANAMPFAREMAAEQGWSEKLEFREQDFFDSVPAADVYCISNTAHDWLAEEYVTIMTNVRDSIAPGGVVCVHEPLLLSNWNSAEQWVRALWMACYAMTLHKLTKGKGTCYTREEHYSVLSRCGFVPVGEPTETRDGCTALFYKMKSDVSRQVDTALARPAGQ